MSNGKSSTIVILGGSLKLTTFLFLVFLFLKLAEIGAVAAWSWWWVTSPLWLGWAVICGVCIFVVAIVGIVLGVSKLHKTIQRKMHMKGNSF